MPACIEHLGTKRAVEAFRQSYLGAWVIVRGLFEVVCSKLGCWPGEPYADMTWGMLMTMILSTLCERLEAAGSSFEINYKNNGSFLI